jgi:hypothetical protein
LATSPTEKPWVDIAIRLIPLLTALGLVLGFATLCDHVPTLNQLRHPFARETVSPTDFVNAHADDADSVAVSARAVEKAMLASCDAGIADRASFQQTLSEAKDKFDAVDKSLVASASNPPTGQESAYNDMEKAVVQLSNAVSTASSFVDSKKPSDLKNYSTQWQQGRQQWNEAVTNIWKAAGQTPPIVDKTVAAGCMR